GETSPLHRAEDLPGTDSAGAPLPGAPAEPPPPAGPAAPDTPAPAGTPAAPAPAAGQPWGAPPAAGTRVPEARSGGAEPAAEQGDFALAEPGAVPAPPVPPVPEAPPAPPAGDGPPTLVDPAPAVEPAEGDAEAVPAGEDAPADPREAVAAPADGGGKTCVACRAGQVDPDGYCENCGHAQPRERDHMEEEIAGAAAVSDRGL
ncbi:protein phosphatase, partial [Streptomyces sp. KAI-27]|nr:protein phosphatase [Streptomyces sp. KAI-27]